MVTGGCGYRRVWLKVGYYESWCLVIWYSEGMGYPYIHTYMRDVTLQHRCWRGSGWNS